MLPIWFLWLKLWESNIHLLPWEHWWKQETGAWSLPQIDWPVACIHPAPVPLDWRQLETISIATLVFVVCAHLCASPHRISVGMIIAGYLVHLWTYNGRANKTEAKKTTKQAQCVFWIPQPKVTFACSFHLRQSVVEMNQNRPELCRETSCHQWVMSLWW